MKKQIIKINDLPITKQIELRAILERNKPKTRTQIKTKQQSQLKKISKNDYQNWFFNSLN
ncbi:MAG: hypothetical protein EBT39_05105 [Sphingobacteriia bacterium]|nr:hypothetical protein [Candidatus Fonsibacter lacus]